MLSLSPPGKWHAFPEFSPSPPNRLRGEGAPAPPWALQQWGGLDASFLPTLDLTFPRDLIETLPSGLLSSLILLVPLPPSKAGQHVTKESHKIQGASQGARSRFSGLVFTDQGTEK